jgi:hypothetical protein
MLSAVVSVGTIVRRGNGDNPETFTDIPGQLKVSAPLSREAKPVEVTDMAVKINHAGNQTYKGTGVVNNLPFTVHFQYKPGDPVHEALRADVGSNRSFQVYIPTIPSQTYTGDAHVNGVKVGELNIDGLFEADLELQPSGAWALV